MAKKLRDYRPGDYLAIGKAIERLQDARHLLTSAGAKRATTAVRSALKSAEGARRHTSRLMDRVNLAERANRVDEIAQQRKRNADHARAARVAAGICEGCREPSELCDCAIAPVPPCAASMGCLCAFHARDGAADQPCNATE